MSRTADPQPSQPPAARQARRAIGVDDEGLTLPRGVDGSFDVHFDAQHVWSFTAETASAPQLVSWPRTMRPWLDGSTRVRVSQSDRVLSETDHSFGSGEGEIRFIDEDDIPLMVDKWGLLQRPFAGRDPAVVELMMDVTEAIFATLREDCGLEGWLAFGSLLGAAREGKVIGHDSDVDLAYLSAQESPAAMMREMYAVTRALRARGMRVVNKSGSFVTVMFDAPDGGVGSVDVYTCFYLGPVLHETATVRAEVPRSAIEPLGTISFEGRMLPAPADVETMLEVSYGPGWRVPDPSFSHRPGRETARRFHDWFGHYWHNRREWERTVRGEGVDLETAVPSPMASAVIEQLRDLHPDTAVVDIGCGRGRDVVMLARAGHRAVGLDYARWVFRSAKVASKAEGLPTRFVPVNLYDRRDALSAAAVLARTLGPHRAVMAGGIWDSLMAVERDNALALLHLLLRHGGTAWLEFDTDPAPGTGRGVAQGVRRYPVSAREMTDAVRARGGEVVDLCPVTPTPGSAADPLHRTDASRRRMTVRWPERTR